MKKLRLNRIISIMIIFAGIILLNGNSVYADDQIRDTDVTSPSSGNTIVLVDGTFVYLSKDEILGRINEIRQEACKEGVRDPRDESRNLTESDYTPIKWSSDLEWIAQTRAAEATVHMDHGRPNGGKWYGIKYNGISSNAEDIAWNGSANILGGINQWYGEKDDWVNKTENAVTGHYTSIINPNYTYIGIGAFKPASGYGAVAGELKSGGSLDESQTGAQGAYKQKIEVTKESISLKVEESKTVHIGKTDTISVSATSTYTNNLGSSWSPRVSNVTLTDGVAYESSNPEIVTVDDKGEIFGVKAGEATVSVKSCGSTCEVPVTVEDHTWNEEYTVDKAATETEDGSRSIHCSVCDAIKDGSTVVIPKTGGSGGDPQGTNNDEDIKAVIDGIKELESLINEAAEETSKAGKRAKTSNIESDVSDAEEMAQNVANLSNSAETSAVALYTKAKEKLYSLSLAATSEEINKAHDDLAEAAITLSKARKLKAKAYSVLAAAEYAASKVAANSAEANNIGTWFAVTSSDIEEYSQAASDDAKKAEQKMQAAKDASMSADDAVAGLKSMLKEAEENVKGDIEKAIKVASEAAADAKKAANNAKISFKAATKSSDEANVVAKAEKQMKGKIVKSGWCGKTSSDHLRWFLTKDGTLKIVGTGKMADYDPWDGDEWYPQWYDNKKDIRKVVIEEGLTVIGRDAFSRCDNLVSVSFPNSLVRIEQCAFAICGSIKQLEFPSGLKTIEQGAFQWCDSLINITIPGTMKYVSGFENCKNLVSVTMKPGVKTIGYYAFDGCNKLKVIKIPNTVKTIDYCAFSHCTRLKSIYIPDSVSYLGHQVLYNCTNLKTVHLPRGVKRIRANTITGSKKLKKLVIPKGVTIIGKSAIEDCSALKTIKLPSTLKNLPRGSIVGCDALKHIKYTKKTKIAKHAVVFSPIKTKNYKLKGIKKGCTISWKKKTLAEGYQIQIKKGTTIKYDYYTYYQFRPWHKLGKGCKTVNAKRKTNKKTISKLKSHNRYVVWIRYYRKIDGKKYYSQWSYVRDIVIK